jgi:hypothetical protein
MRMTRPTTSVRICGVAGIRGGAPRFRSLVGCRTGIPAKEPEMERSRGLGVASGCVWLIVLSAVAWGGLGVSGGAGSPRHTSDVLSAAAGIDTTPPRDLVVDGGPNAEGWYAEPTDYRWTAQDPESGIDRCHGGSIEAIDSAVSRTVYGTCTNGAGLAAPYEGFSYRYDGTPPRLDPVVVPPVVPRRGLVVAEPRGSDALSGVARQSCNGGRTLSTRRPGPHTVTCYVRDRAGNLATATVSYLVVDERQRND